ncbi:MAG: cobaltochelatase subunit CobN [Bacteroidales bacterium]|jgi:cobaltochelatase CobN|nr:cobaltochelatase subunit CobN [Bacteroidales bacterium]
MRLLRKKGKKIIICASIALFIIGICALFIRLNTVKIALLNFPNFQYAKMFKSNTNRYIDLKNITLEDFEKLKNYDAVLIFGMGIRMTDEHRKALGVLKNKGITIYSTAVTDPVNQISTLDSLQAANVSAYLENGSQKNYRNLFNYMRKEVLKKHFFNQPVAAPTVVSSDIFFHLDGENVYNSVSEFENYYKKNGYYKENAPKIALICGMMAPFGSEKAYLDSLIIALEEKQLNVYPFYSFSKRFEFLESISPDAVVYLPHGRLLMGEGDKITHWLKSRNIPLFCPLTVHVTIDEWLKNKHGMFGGFLSQSIVMPEIDGGIMPFTVFAQQIDNEGLYSFVPISHRLQQFVNIVSNYINLKHKPNKDKKLAIYYYKGAGNNSLLAFGLDVVPSLYNLLQMLKNEGYTVKNLPSSVSEFKDLIYRQGPVFNSYAEGKINQFLHSNYPAFVGQEEYNLWLKKRLLPQVEQQLQQKYGTPPGEYFTLSQNGEKMLAVTRIELGNIVLLPQPVQGTGDNSFSAVHGDNPLPPYHYIAAYLWAQNHFQADAMLHFGTHGSLEFIPGKQVALSSYDWSDILVGQTPHFYYYSIADVGEAMIAKRRTYATLISHLNPPFIETQLNEKVEHLQQKIRNYLSSDAKNKEKSLNLQIKAEVIKMGFHRDLKLDSSLMQIYSDEDLQKIDNFAEELCSEKITAGQHITGIAFDERKIQSSVVLICSDPIAYSLAQLDVLKGKITPQQIENQPYFNANYYLPAQKAVKKMLANPNIDPLKVLVSIGISPSEIEKAKQINAQSQPTANPMAMMMAKQPTKGNKMTSQSPAMSHSPQNMPQNTKIRTNLSQNAKNHPQNMSQNAPSQSEQLISQSIITIENTLQKVNQYYQNLKLSPQNELSQLVNAFNGGYILPSSGGDFIANPSTLPSGRNLYAINAEAMPTPQAWEKGVTLAKELIDKYRKNHSNQYPQKVSFTLWSGSFIESEGATIAQILYLLGVEPVRDQFNRVLDVRLIPENELNRPHIDVVVQTSGQFRDLAASRLLLLQKAIDLVANTDTKVDNFVQKGNQKAEEMLLKSGFSPKDARQLASVRIFGGVNGMAGTGITAMVESGARWENESQIAEVYLNNMGAIYSDTGNWGDFQGGVFAAALQNTDIVVQPRQSNTWGALSLDHVYEFMGGITLAVRNVTGKEPEAYFNDLRNHYHVRIQDLKTAIGVEARTTIFNPAYIKEHIKSESDANSFAEIIRNTYGWNVMKPSVIDNELWEQIFDTYIDDKYNLNLKTFFETQNPAALQEMTAVMLETYRKGYWKTANEKIAKLSTLHADLVTKYGAGCSGFVCDNAKLQHLISSQLPDNQRDRYNSQISQAREIQTSDNQNVVLKKETLQDNSFTRKSTALSTILAIVGGVAVVLVVLLIIVKRRKND